MIRKVMLILVLAASLLFGCAFAQEDIHMPGETAAQLFRDAFERGRMIKSDVQLSLSADPAALALTAEDAAILDVLNNTTLTFGAGKIKDGLRVELGAKYAADAPVAADAALNITRDGILLETSLLEGESISARWETLLALSDMNSEEIQLIMALRDADLRAAAAQLIQTAAPYAEMAAQVFAPYGRTIASAVAALPVEINENVPADGYYPAAAQEIVVTITAKDLGALITQLTDQLENDSMLSAFLTASLSEQTDIPFSSTAQLCAAIREAAAVLTDTAHPVMLFVGLDEAGNPLYISVSHEDEYGELMLLEAIHAPGGTPDSGAFTLGAYVIEDQEIIESGFDLSITYAADAANPNICDHSTVFSLFADGASVMSMDFAASSAAATVDGQQGYNGKQTFALSIDDTSEPVSIIMASDSTHARTAGGEQAQVTGTMDVYAGETALPITFSSEFIVTPGADGPRAVYTETCAMPDVGIDKYAEICTLYTETYDPATTAALALTQLETVSSADMDAFVNRLTASAQSLADSLQTKLPPEALQLFRESAAE